MGRFLMAGRGGLALAVFGTAPYEGCYSVTGGGALALAVVSTGPHEGAFDGGWSRLAFSLSLSSFPRRDDFRGWESSLSASFFSPLPPQRGDFRGLYARTGGVACCDETRNGAFSIDSGRIPRERRRSVPCARGRCTLPDAGGAQRTRPVAAIDVHISISHDLFGLIAHTCTKYKIQFTNVIPNRRCRPLQRLGSAK